MPGFDDNPFAEPTIDNPFAVSFLRSALNNVWNIQINVLVQRRRLLKEYLNTYKYFVIFLFIYRIRPSSRSLVIQILLKEVWMIIAPLEIKITEMFPG